MEIEGNFYRGFFYDVVDFGEEKNLLLFTYHEKVNGHFKTYSTETIKNISEIKQVIDTIRQQAHKELPPENFPPDIANRNLWRFPISIKGKT